MSTTMFIPMPEWQALLFLREREKAFQRLLTRDKFNCLEQEVVPTLAGLYGFRVRQDALDHGLKEYPHGFAMVRFVVPGLLSGNWQMRRYVSSASLPESGTPLYLIDKAGLEQLRDDCAAGSAEVMVDQIFGPPQPRTQAQPCTGDDCGRLHLD